MSGRTYKSGAEKRKKHFAQMARLVQDPKVNNLLHRHQKFPVT